MMKRFILILFFLFPLLTGCSDAEAPTSTSLLEQDLTAVNEDATQLTIACWVPDMELQLLINEYNASQSEYQISITYYYDGTEYALDRMNAELVSGQCPDLYFLDSMDLDALQNAGLLLDLYPIMEADTTFNPDDYYMNIWDLFAVDKSLYEFVPCFTLNGMITTSAHLGTNTSWSIETFNQFCEELAPKFQVLNTSLSDMLTYMTQNALFDYISLSDGICSFNTPEFEEWLSFIKSFPEYVSDQQPLIRCGITLGIYDYITYKSIYQDTPVYIAYPGSGIEGPTASALWSFAISSTTAHSDACWDFLTSFLSMENQCTYFSGWGFPMSKRAMESELNAATLAVTDPGFPGYEQTNQYGSPLIPLDENDINYLTSLFESIDHRLLRSDTILEIIQDETTAYFSGDKDAEDVSELVQNRVQIYLSEHH